MTEEKNIIASALDTLKLFNLLSADYQPRTHKQIVQLANAHRHTWSSTKVFDMLKTLQAGQFLRQAESGEWSVSPHITAIAVAYQESIIRRSSAIIAEVAEIKQSTQERMQ